MKNKIYLIFPIILLSSCTSSLNEKESFKLIEENKVYQIINSESVYSSVNIVIEDRKSVHELYSAFSLVLNENNLNKELTNQTTEFSNINNEFRGKFTNVYLKVEFEYYYSLTDYIIFVKQNDNIYCFNGNKENYDFIVNYRG